MSWPFNLIGDVRRAALAELNFLEFGGDSTGATQMATRLQEACSRSRRVYLPPGVYRINAAVLPPNTEIRGAGDSTILHMAASDSSIFYINSGSASSSDNVSNVRISNLMLRGTCDTDGFSEHKHLLNLNGVSDWIFDNVTFRGFRGDGLYLGSGSAGEERHNNSITLRKCRFDGINRANRNGISCIDIDGLLVDDCDFMDITSASMPGAIDLEPNSYAWPVIRNVTIKGSRFRRIGGNVGQVGMICPAAVTAAPRNIQITGNRFDDYQGTGAVVMFSAFRVPTTTTPDNDIRFSGNTSVGGRKPFNFLDGKGIAIENNSFDGFTHGANLSYTGATDVVREATVRNNTFTRCGTTQKVGLYVHTVHGLRIEENIFDDCGDGTSSPAMDFHTGTSSRVKMRRNVVKSPTGKTTIAVVKEAGHTFTPDTNEFFACDFGALSHSFVAEQTDSVETAYTPTAVGATDAGTFTVTQAVGAYRREGKTVHFRAKVVGTGHTGTGQLWISLPVDVASGVETAVQGLATGVSGTGGQAFLLTNSGSAGGKAGVVRCYTTGTGTYSNIAVPTGAFTVWVSGSYRGA